MVGGAYWLEPWYEGWGLLQRQNFNHEVRSRPQGASAWRISCWTVEATQYRRGASFPLQRRWGWCPQTCDLCVEVGMIIEGQGRGEEANGLSFVPSINVGGSCGSGEETPPSLDLVTQ